MKQISKRLTYANVMSSIAVFLVLGGATAIAAGLAKNSVGSKQLKKNAVTTAKIKNGAVSGAKVKDGAVTTTKIADGAVTTAKIADKAVTGAKIDSSTVGTVPKAAQAENATTAQNLSGLYFAVVNANATLARGSAGVTSEDAGTAAYRVFLPEGVDAGNCFFLGSLGGDNPGSPEDGQISVNPSSTADNALYVRTADSAGADADKQFTVMARC